ncbi:hypothetical protein Tco_0820844 [Tanacetum coccineum]|uniref:Uncharacterized protein n=1 Tax=Tanacetum coccineum TaxID=301880 RepID=A0ABQ5AAJ8_9ASTR
MLRDYVMKLKECASKAGFKACKREFLGLDGAFMKGPFPGKLLTPVGVDPNNGIYPLAYGIVETESRERGASASTVKGSTSGTTNAATQKGNKTVGSVKGAASGSTAAAQKGKKTIAASGKGSSQATQPSGNSPKKKPKKK